MNEWAAKLLSVFPERSRADLDQYLLEVVDRTVAAVTYCNK